MPEVPLVVTESAILGLTIGGTQFLKRMGTPSSFAPATALVLGVVFTVAVRQDFNAQSILAGVVYAFMSMGIFSGTKALANA